MCIEVVICNLEPSPYFKFLLHHGKIIGKVIQTLCINSNEIHFGAQEEFFSEHEILCYIDTE